MPMKKLKKNSKIKDPKTDLLSLPYDQNLTTLPEAKVEE